MKWPMSIKIVLLFSATVFAESNQEFKKDDIVLFPSVATSGRMFRMAREVQRVGLVRRAEGQSLTIQEINYPSRQGQIVYIQTPEGDKLYEGTHDVPTDSESLALLVSEIISDEGLTFTRGSRFQIRNGRSRGLGYVIYVFKNARASYVAVTDQKGWECYTNFGEDCHTRQFVRLTVRRVSSSR